MFFPVSFTSHCLCQVTALAFLSAADRSKREDAAVVWQYTLRYMGEREPSARAGNCSFYLHT